MSAIKLGPAPERIEDVDSKFEPVQAGELTDLALLPGEFRAFRGEVRDSLAGIVRALLTLGRIEERMDVLIDRQNHFETRLADVERRLGKLEQERPKRARK